MNKEIDLTSTTQNFNFEFTSVNDASNVRVDFFLGGSTTNVWLDAVAIREKCEFSIPADAPSTPTDLVANTISDKKIDLVWFDNSNNEKGFTIERKRQSGNTFEEIGEVTENATIYNDDDLAPNTIYEYRVLAFNDNGKSYYTNISIGTTLETNVDPEVSVTIDNCMSDEMSIGDIATFTSSISPDDLADQSVKWSSSAPTIVSVDMSSGEITALSAGIATITVTTNEGSMTDQCEVTVEENSTLSTSVDVNSLFKLHPNPANSSGMVTVTLIDKGIKHAAIEVINLSGAVVYRNPQVLITEGSFDMNLLNFSVKGIYLVHIKSESKIMIEKLIVN